MKFNEKWLSELIGREISPKSISETLTSLGLETHLLKRRKILCKGVFIGKIISISAESIEGGYTVYKANISSFQNIKVFTRGRNINECTFVPIILKGGYTEKIGEFSGEAVDGMSFDGMICSRYELGLDNTESVDAMVLPKNSPLGMDFSEYFIERDRVFDVDVTHNRSDCHSVLGIAREICIAKKIQMKYPAISDFNGRKSWKVPIKIEDPSLCGRYVGRVVKGVNLQKPLPFWIIERLACNNIPFTNSILDIINYIMLEMGQAINIFDFDAVKDGIEIRKSIAGEEIYLEDNKKIKLNAGSVIVSNSSQPISIAGVSNCFLSKVKVDTNNIFIESAAFNPKDVRLSASMYSIKGKFDRKMDNASQEFAVEYATNLILAIFGGYPGVTFCDRYKAQSKKVEFQIEKTNEILGTRLANREILQILHDSGVSVIYKDCKCMALIPSYRMDLNYEIDIIEEIAKVYGYENIPKKLLPRQNKVKKQNKNHFSLSNIAKFLSNRGYNEIFTYSFYSSPLDSQIEQSIVLSNPMSSDMSVMRSDLLQGLLKTAQYNQNRKNYRLRLFEIGSIFQKKHGNYVQSQRIGVLASGNAFSEQWCIKNRKIDFYDAKLEIECLLDKAGFKDEITFQKISSSKFFEIDESADILVRSKKIGVIGLVNKELLKKMKIIGPVYVFEIDLSFLNNRPHTVYKNISKFPSIRRDISIVSPKEVSARDIKLVVLSADYGKLIEKVIFFDLYKEMEDSSSKKYISLGMIFQHPLRTLKDLEINVVVENILLKLKNELGIHLRSSQ